MHRRAIAIVFLAFPILLGPPQRGWCDAGREESRALVERVPAEISAIAGSALYRVVIVERGWDPIYHEVYCQWLRDPEEPRSRTVAATRRVDALSGGMCQVFDPVFIDPSTVRVVVYLRYGRERREVTITMKPDYEFVVKGDLPIEAPSEK